MNFLFLKTRLLKKGCIPRCPVCQYNFIKWTMKLQPLQDNDILFGKGGTTMNQKYTSHEKEITLTRYNNGEPVSQISRETGTPRSTIYAWIKKQTNQSSGKLPTLREYRTL